MTFFHLFKYRIKNLVRYTSVSFWTLFFPIILGTLFYLGFGNLMDDSDIEFAPIKIAVVTEEENTTFSTVLNEMEDMFDAKEMTKDEAFSLLESKDIEGIIYVCNKPYMEVLAEGINQTIMKSFLDEYLKQEHIIKTVIRTNPEQLQSTLATLNSSDSYVTEKKLYSSETNTYTQYFYALIAMSCLFGSFLGLQSAIDLQANMSNLGMRREISSTYKICAVLSDVLAAFTFDIFCVVVQICYLAYVLGVNLGDNVLGITLIAIVGSLVGITFGTFIGSVFTCSFNTKLGVTLSVSMFCCFISDLMISGLKYFIEQKMPIINRINPAALITDSMHTLNMYGYCPRLYINLISLIAIALLFIVISGFALRRRSYEHI